MSERVKFILEWQRRWDASQGKRCDVAELSRVYGVSRETAYVWIRRYRESNFDVRALEERSRRPRSYPRALTDEIETLIVEARKVRPKWGPVMLRAWLSQKFPRRSFPCASSIAAVLRRRGLAAPRKRRRRSPGEVVVTPPFPECRASNDTWCMDFKGWFRLGTREKCYPFTLIDAWSRYLLRCEGTLTPNGDEVERFLDSAFREFGLPKTIRSDGGPPFFAAQSPASLSRLAIWLLRLGITLECIAPAKPQQNGTLERFHRTLKHEVEPAATLRHQRRDFDLFRSRYNFDRPHSSLAMKPPAHVYRRSSIRYPRSLLPPYLDPFATHIERVDRHGMLAWRRGRVFIGEAFAGEYVSLWPAEATRWAVFFGTIRLGHFDQETLTLVPRRRGKGTLRFSLTGENQE